MVQAIRAGKLQYRPQLDSREPVSSTVPTRGRGAGQEAQRDDFLKDRQAKTELARITRELKQLKTKVAALEERKACLTDNWVAVLALAREGGESRGLRGHGITSVVSAPTCPGSSGDPGSGQWVRSFSRR